MNPYYICRYNPFFCAWRLTPPTLKGPSSLTQTLKKVLCKPIFLTPSHAPLLTFRAKRIRLMTPCADLFFSAYCKTDLCNWLGGEGEPRDGFNLTSLR